jgi:hypothetical protein
MHVAADLLLIGKAWILSDVLQLMAVGLPLSQCSLVALWAAASRANLFLRFVAPLIGVVVCWYVLSRQLTWGIGEAASAAWAVLIGVQTLMIVMVINVYQRARPGDVKDGVKHSRLAFDLRTLILWTMAVAIAFAVVQYGRSKLQWTAGVADWAYFDAMPILGVFNAVLAVHWLWALASGSWRQRSAKIAITVLSVGAIVYFLCYVVDKIVVGAPGISLLELSLITIAQSLLITSTLAVVLVATRQRVQ